MAKTKRKVPGINASSTADISFMLLIFFLITTSMDTDRGLARRLPPPPENTENQEDVIVKERNVLQVRINKDDQLMVGGEWFDIKQLREKAKEFISNPSDDPNLPENMLNVCLSSATLWLLTSMLFLCKTTWAQAITCTFKYKTNW